MAKQRSTPQRRAAQRAAKVFSRRQYRQSPKTVIVHAQQTGRAVVVTESGRVRVAIDIPTTKLPALD